MEEKEKRIQRQEVELTSALERAQRLQLRIDELTEVEGAYSRLGSDHAANLQLVEELGEKLYTTSQAHERAEQALEVGGARPV